MKFLTTLMLVLSFMVFTSCAHHSKGKSCCDKSKKEDCTKKDCKTQKCDGKSCTL